MKYRGLLMSNSPYLLWVSLYFVIVWCILGATVSSFIITLVMYAISIFLALCPAGEYIFRFMQSARPIATRKEKEYLMPIFTEVYQTAKKNTPKLSSNVELLMIDAMYVNAFALGGNTIAVTRGMVESMSEEQLKGILAHEFGHLANGDTKALLIKYVGNGIFTLGIMLVRVFLSIFEAVTRSFWFLSVFELAVVVLRIALEVGLFAFMWLGDIILSATSRQNEFGADEYAFYIGYGIELTEGLYALRDINMGEKMKFTDRLRATHPYTAERIGRLENLIEV